MKRFFILYISILSLSTFAEKLPNIILIMADDIGFQAFSMYGGSDVKTPTLEKLSQKGVTFNHCYSQPLCAPSRAQIMTGKYNFRNYIKWGLMTPNQKTFANLLKEQGYSTCIAGKWQLNYSDKENLIQKFGFDQFCLWLYDGRGARYWNPRINQNGNLLSTKGLYGPDIYSDFICNFIEKNKDKPFFAYYCMTLAHSPFCPTPDSSPSLKEKYQKILNDSPKSPRKSSKKSSKPYDENPNFDASEPSGFTQDPEKKQAYVDMVAYADKLVGKIYKKIEDLNLLDNTIFIFTSDNGTPKGITLNWNNKQISGGKGSMKDMGNRVPFILVYPNYAKQGLKTNDLIDFTDVYPTFAEITNAKILKNQNIDGFSFLPSLNGENKNPRKWSVCHFTPRLRGTGTNVNRYVRNQKFKLYQNGKFIDVSKDILEENDLGAKPESKDYMMLKKILMALPPLDRYNEEEIKDKSKIKTYPDWKLPSQNL